ncbi:hypothetical protein ACHAWF_013283 [Thalassiosira exigua]
MQSDSRPTPLSAAPMEMGSKSSFNDRKAATLVLSLIASFLLGSVIILGASLLWHSELVAEASLVMRSNMVEFPLVRLASSVWTRRRRAAQQPIMYSY